ncbi:hypothetical protein [Frigoriglobus tundricola]|uniref:Glycosyltransferase RgtA/B/C/D-like domain-containing protein n=1 Tax=Frigoriglobus tundricola TaxID=2774151 RepID=A0A6M5YVD5_9BACT|nr:hypothetical protein [Frigoriglobus tundricola]QJW97434.1 hypothetical protein FTUN_5008 [Frigoriglobus tundricola]
MSKVARTRWAPWRSAACGWLVAGAFLAAGAPLFLRMPLWCDPTLYAVAARAVASGGVHYRDVFDTNPPGFVWLLCGVRGVLGTSSEALRLTDLLLVGLVTAGLLWWARKAGADRAAVAWAAAAGAAFYPFTHEFNHVQRDVWMMLPAGAALVLRLRRAEDPTPPAPLRSLPGPVSGASRGPGQGKGEEDKDPTPNPSLKGGEQNLQSFDTSAGAEEAPRAVTLSLKEGGRGVGLSPFLEGLLWGAGCWIKPHLLFIALAAWLVTQRRLRWRDHLAVFAGGAVAGGAGAGWLVATGAWPYFLDVWRTWNADYLATVYRELPFRVLIQLEYFPPYSACALLAVPLAVANVRARSDAPGPFRRRVLAAVYLAWLVVTLLLQRPFHYLHVPETLLMIAVFAANRWPVPFALVLLPTTAGLVLALSGRSVSHVPPHPVFDAARTQWWVRCLDRDPPREVRRGVAMWAQHFGGTDPVELGAVADYLRGQNVRDGELIAWHDSPHGLYLDLGVEPGFRFMHVGTAAGLGKWQERTVLRELRTAVPRARFAVSDMHRVTARYADLNDPSADGLPNVLPGWQRDEFPFDQPVVFRSPSGRYLVHRILKPVTSARIPDRLDQAEPNKE